MKRFSCTILTAAFFALPCLAASSSDQAIEATTAAGERVRLLPNGRWEYADQAKQAEAKKVFDKYPENRNPDAQGGVFGVGRSINPGEKDYNRGTLNPKGR